MLINSDSILVLPEYIHILILFSQPFGCKVTLFFT